MTTNNEQIKIKYNSSVLVNAGWRSITITAKATKISEKMAIVDDVLSIDDEELRVDMSRTGANRQKYNGFYIASRETGLKKRLSSCSVSELHDSH